MEVTAIIQRYYPERRRYLGAILDALTMQTKVPDRVIIWNNFGGVVESLLENSFFPIHVIHSDVNTLMGRYAAALLASTPAVFIQDDDLLCGPDTIERLTSRLSDFPRTLFGISGSNINRASSNPYTDGTTIYDGPADIVIGRCFALTRRELVSRLTLLHPTVGRSDDIALSRQGHNVVIPCDITDLDEQGVGLRHDAEHSSERDQQVKRLFGVSK